MKDHVAKIEHFVFLDHVANSEHFIFKDHMAKRVFLFPIRKITHRVGICFDFRTGKDHVAKRSIYVEILPRT